jgi:hypothetical protein
MIQTKFSTTEEMGMKNNQGLHVMFAENLYSIGFKALKPLPLILCKMLEGTKHLRYSKVKDQLRHSLAPTTQHGICPL